MSDLNCRKRDYHPEALKVPSGNGLSRKENSRLATPVMRRVGAQAGWNKCASYSLSAARRTVISRSLAPELDRLGGESRLAMRIAVLLSLTHRSIAG